MFENTVVTRFRNLYIATTLACAAALLLGILAIRLPGESFTSVCIYFAASTVITYLFFWVLRRTLTFSTPVKHGWFVIRGGLIDPITCLMITAPLAFTLFSNAGDSFIVLLCMLYHLLRFAAFVLLARHYIDLRPFVRGESSAVPWPHHDGSANAPDAVFFRSPPDWLGEIVSGGSSLRWGDELPPRSAIITLAALATLLVCLLSQAILFAAHEPPYVKNLPVYLMVFSLFITPSIMLILLVRKRVCSFVGANGVVDYKMEFDGSVESWEVRFDEYQHLKKHTTVNYRGFAGIEGAYIGHSESRSFENSDGSVQQVFNYNWEDPASTRTEGTLPDVRATFWKKIEAVWAMME